VCNSYNSTLSLQTRIANFIITCPNKWSLSNALTFEFRIYIETPRPNTNRHVHAHKCLHCARIEPDK
jgi:hypothetical protein